VNYLSRLTSNHSPPDLCLQISQDDRREPPASGYIEFLLVPEALL
jgi:hypothetical protein